jgi:hypothetical protein
MDEYIVQTIICTIYHKKIDKTSIYICMLTKKNWHTLKNFIYDVDDTNCPFIYFF